MATPSKQATAAKTALAYVTVGTLTVVWTIVYYLYLNRREGTSDVAYLVVYGLFATGCMLTLIGLAVGRLGRAAMKAEVAPTPDGVVPVVPSAAAAAPPVAAAPPTALPRAIPAPSVQ